MGVVIIIIIFCPLLHLFWGRNNQCQLKRQTTTGSVNKLTWWGEREEKQSIERRKSEKDRKRDISFLSLSSPENNNGFHAVDTVPLEIFVSGIFDSQCAASNSLGRKLYCGWSDSINLLSHQDMTAPDFLSIVQYNDWMMHYFQEDPRPTLTVCEWV